MARKKAKPYRIPVNWSTPYDHIFNFKTFDFGYFSALDNEVWDRIVSRLPKSYSILDQSLFGRFMSKIGVAVKSPNVIEKEYQKITPKKR